jgi:hypothetical protein
MRDFRAVGDINVGGNVIIDDSSQLYKPYAQCSNEVLLKDEVHRQDLLNSERSRKWRIFTKSLLGGGALLVAASIWFYIQGRMNFASLVLGIGGCMISAASFQFFSKPTEFELRQLEALKEIATILRERGIR